MARSKHDRGDYADVNTIKIEVTKNALCKVVTEVPQWEAQVVLALWGDDARPVGAVEAVRRKLPASVEDEYQRLVDKYGPKDADTPIVAQVYGSFGPGIRALMKEINISVVGGAPFGGGLTPVEKAEEEDFDDTPLSDEEIDALDTVPAVSLSEDFADLAADA